MRRYWSHEALEAAATAQASMITNIVATEDEDEELQEFPVGDDIVEDNGQPCDEEKSEDDEDEDGNIH
jgi:hypothetical protein